MEMIKVLIANPEEEFTHALADALGEGMQILTCDTGTRAMELLDSFRPHILVLDLVLSGLDGLAILQRLAARPNKPGVLVVSKFMSDYVWDALERLGIAYVLRKPCSVQAAVEHIQDIAALMEPATVTQVDLNTATANLLLRLGMSAKLDGFGYLQAALPMYMADPRQSLTKELYAAVAKLYNKEGRHVERSIRNAIELAWKKRDDDLWREFFQIPPGFLVPKLSNGTFIARLSCHLACLAVG